MQRAAAGDVVAEFSFDYDELDDTFTDFAVSIMRAGQVAHTGLLSTKACRAAPCRPVGENGAVRVRDLDGDGEPEVLLDLFTGGAHCCFIGQIFIWDGARYRIVTRDFRDVGYRLAGLSGDGRTQLLSADTRFAYRWSSFASSYFPVQIFEVDGTRLLDITDEHPDRIRRDAARAWRFYRSHRRRGGEVRGAIAGWAANRYLLGHRQSTLRILRRMARRGQLAGTAPRRQRKFVSELDRLLRRWGYHP